MTTHDKLTDEIVAIEGWSHNHEDGPPMCAVCGDEYSLHDDCEPTPCCDVCVHRMVDKLLSEVRRLNVDLRCANIQVADRGQSYADVKAEIDKLRAALVEACDIGSNPYGSGVVSQERIAELRQLAEEK